MSHLTLETLARLIDEAPDPTEAGHLDICSECRDELEAMRADVAALHALPDPEPAAAQWLRLEQRLEHEGLVRSNRRGQPALLRMAAAIVIFIMGGASAALVLRAPNTEYLTANQPPAAVVSDPPVMLTLPVETAADNPVAQAAKQVATVPTPPRSAPRPARTAQEAATVLRSAESDYLAALTRFTELSGRVEEGDRSIAKGGAIIIERAGRRARLRECLFVNFAFAFGAGGGARQ